ncbi:hypothetical protein FH966_11340 [Lentibacillus cibarius]|uniref:Uncharacterized protein n=1 Tax=Lentibacillus cibarius TaxID=2583219 RepID=A0A549YK16_9BACI|nr:hypothetical protein [Lentibacillus cibarius]TRM12226.1 hypothetical protein FH966_11340 [Lentibacillus cibarius]
MRKAGKIILFLCVIAFISLYLFYARGQAELVCDKASQVVKDDFIMHIRVEDLEDGFKVFRSIQYTGDKPVEMKHQTPLVSLSFKNRNHDYTGNHITKTLRKGSIYHPQKPKTFQDPTPGEYNLYCESAFTVDGKEVAIKLKEKLTFE